MIDNCFWKKLSALWTVSDDGIQRVDDSDAVSASAAALTAEDLSMYDIVSDSEIDDILDDLIFDD